MTTEARDKAPDDGAVAKLGPATATAARPVEDVAIPVHVLGEIVYCPRLAYLRWIQGEQTDDRGEPRRRRSAEDEPVPTEDPFADLGPRRTESLTALGLTAVVDFAEADDGARIPVETKRGRAPDLPEGAWPSDRVRLCARGLLIRAHGWSSDHGELYFAESRRRVRVDFDDALISATRTAVERAVRLSAEDLPPPLIDSPKCAACALVAVCLPDEVRAAPEPRPLAPARHDALPLYIQSYNHRIGVSGEELVVTGGDEKRSVRLMDTSQVCLFGNVQVTTPAIKTLCELDIPIAWFSHGGWFYGFTRGLGSGNAHLRIAQHRAAADPTRALALAKHFVRAKIRNCRTLLRRNHPDPGPALDALKAAARAVDHADRADSLLGIEGTAARHYFAAFGGMLKAPDSEGTFRMDGRNRRPPTDPVNALLSYAYALLVKDWTVTLQAVGFDPFVGFLHQPRHGRPALALDLMEEFRPLVADSIVLWAVNNRAVRPEHFVRCGLAVNLTPEGRAAFIKTYERRMDELVTHPVFGYRLTYRRLLEVQARLLGRHLEGELPDYPAFETR
jgi:CRISPR-associated endonuclease Cas1